MRLNYFMTNTPSTQSQKRFEESLGALFLAKGEEKSKRCLILKSSSDVGVMRNGGRNGARFAPQSFLSYFKRLTQSESTSQWRFSESEVSCQIQETQNFESAQVNEAKKIRQLLQDKFDFLLHLGGGHDHVYPLLKSMDDCSRIIVINLDAHADTRTDTTPHSGTPFRQFANEYAGDFHLFQIGLHPWANSSSTLSPLEKGQEYILWRNDLQEEYRRTEFFQTILSLMDDNTRVIFSLDADALAGYEVPGVSAVNGKGISIGELELLWEEYRKLPLKHAPLLGIYELNPVYDTLSGLSMRTLAGLFSELLR